MSKDALAPKVGTGVLGNKLNLAEAQAKGCSGNVTASAAFASRVMPLIGRLKDSGQSLNAIAAQLNASNMPLQRPFQGSSRLEALSQSGKRNIMRITDHKCGLARLPSKALSLSIWGTLAAYYRR